MRYAPQSGPVCVLFTFGHCFISCYATALLYDTQWCGVAQYLGIAVDNINIRKCECHSNTMVEDMNVLMIVFMMIDKTVSAASAKWHCYVWCIYVIVLLIRDIWGPVPYGHTINGHFIGRKLVSVRTYFCCAIFGNYLHRFNVSSLCKLLDGRPQYYLVLYLTDGTNRYVWCMLCVSCFITTIRSLYEKVKSY